VKTRVCVCCSAEMVVPKNSGRKWCTPCYKERAKKYAKEHYEKTKEGRYEKYRDKTNAWRKENPVKAMVVRTRSRARKSGLEHNITEEDVVIPDVCPILKIKLKYNTEYAPSLDRIDPTKGYIKGNVQVISMKANAMKNNATDEELRLFAEWVYREVVDTPRVQELV